jgi:hypothetical protein
MFLQADVDDLRERPAGTRWPSELPGQAGPGVLLEYLRNLAEYWADGFEWRKQEA